MTDYLLGIVLAFDIAGLLFIVPLVIAGVVVLLADRRWRRQCAAEEAFREAQLEADGRRYGVDGGLR